MIVKMSCGIRNLSFKGVEEIKLLGFTLNTNAFTFNDKIKSIGFLKVLGSLASSDYEKYPYFFHEEEFKTEFPH